MSFGRQAQYLTVNNKSTLAMDDANLTNTLKWVDRFQANMGKKDMNQALREICDANLSPNKGEQKKM